MDVLAGRSLLVNQRIQRRCDGPFGGPPRGENLVALTPRDGFTHLCVVKEVVMSPVVERGAAVASGLAFEANEKGVSGRDEVEFLHGFGERVAEGLDDFRVVWPGGVVKG